MFSIYHLLWLALCAVLFVFCTWMLRRKNPPLKKVLNLCCAAAILSELTKVFSVISLVPSADGTCLYPYMKLQHLPFHLCSIQILFIFYVRFADDSRFRTALLAFMYPSCLLGALCAIAIPSIFSGSVVPEQSFTTPLAYQYFLYHVMLAILGLYIYQSGQVHILSRHYFSSLVFVFSLGFLSLYLNSAFAVPTYEDGQLISVEYTTNFFFTYQPPIHVQLTQLWQWYLYLGILAGLAMLAIGILYLPIFRRDRRKS